MATYSRVWDAITDSPAEADDLQARSELLYALQHHISLRGWAAEDTAERLALTPARAAQLIAGDITQFSLSDLQQLTSAAGCAR